ncbi:MAG: hypothetical protein WCV62_00790 [Candidatus Peribacteraceae bacterium]
MKKTLFLLGLLLAPAAAWALEVTPPAGGMGGGFAGLVAYIWFHVVPMLQGVFVAFAFFFLFLYAATMVLFSHDESAMTEAKSAYTYAIVGMLIVGASTLIAQAIMPGSAEFIHAEPLTPVLDNIIAYGKGAVAVVLVVNVVIQGFRLVISHGEQEYVDRARKRLFMSFVGTILVILAQAIVVAVNPGMGANLNLLNEEAVGLANFLLAFIGAGVVIAIIVAGIYLVVSVDESLKDRAKGIIKTSIITLIVVLLSYALVNTFIHIASNA